MENEVGGIEGSGDERRRWGLAMKNRGNKNRQKVLVPASPRKNRAKGENNNDNNDDDDDDDDNDDNNNIQCLVSHFKQPLISMWTSSTLVDFMCSDPIIKVMIKLFLRWFLSGVNE